MSEIENLGHVISKHGIRVNPSKIDALLNLPSPTNVKELQCFIAGINYQPLYMLLQKDKE